MTVSRALRNHPCVSAATRRRFVASQADTGNIVIPAHVPAPTAGRIASHGERWRFDFLD